MARPAISRRLTHWNTDMTERQGDRHLEALRDNVLRMLHRELAAVQREIEAYPNDDSLWQLAPGISNSGGTLALHLAGNLRHFVGAGDKRPIGVVAHFAAQAVFEPLEPFGHERL